MITQNNNVNILVGPNNIGVCNLSQHVKVIATHDFEEYADDNGLRVRFLRVEISNTAPAVQSIIEMIANTSWVTDLVDDTIKQSFLECAKPTITKLSNDLTKAVDSGATESIGEYVVSVVARHIIEEIYDYRALPLAEVIKEKVSGNPGFDYHHEKDSIVLIFGEAKYKTGCNAYGVAFGQMVKFIKLKKDIKEVATLGYFLSDDTKANILKGKKGYSAAFSTAGKYVDTAALINNIKRNADFNELLEHEELLIVAVDIND